MYRIGKEEAEAVARVLEARALFKVDNSPLKESMRLEEDLKEVFRTPYALVMTSGHAALTSALVALGIGPGDQVIVPAYTYIATAMAVVAAGAIPVIVDVDETLTIDPAAIERAITPHTRAIIPVHIQGFPCKMDEIMALATRYGLFVLEDACQADGGSFGEMRLGTLGDAGALSFNYFKVITAGEGGALFTPHREVFERALIYHDSSAVAFFGDQLSDVSTQPFCGSEFRTNGITSAILRVQLTRMDGILADLRRNKRYLMDALKKDCRFLPSNDLEGDCGTTLALTFDTGAQAAAFAAAEGINGTVPFHTGKHVYTNWTPIMERRGAFHPLMDPFKMEANAGIIPEYRNDACERTLDLLSRAVYIGVNPDLDTAALDRLVDTVRAALSK